MLDRTSSTRELELWIVISILTGGMPDLDERLLLFVHP